MILVRCFLLLLVLLLAGCVTGDLVLDQSKAASLSHIYIAPIEGPPISGSGLKYVRNLPDMDLTSDEEFSSLGGHSTFDATVSGFGVLTSELDRKIAALSKSAEYVLDSNSDWEPIVEITKEIQRQLEADGIYSAEISNDIKLMPGVTLKAATHFMENWFSPMRDWYGSDPSQFNYPVLPKFSAVLEVFPTYDLIYVKRHFFITVDARMKLIEPETGMVMANTTCSEHVHVAHINKLFSDGATEFKSLFRETMIPTVTECFTKIGLRTK